MIEIEVFQREPKDDLHTIRIWINDKMIYCAQGYGKEELKELRDSLDNELRWLNDYLEYER